MKILAISAFFPPDHGGGYGLRLNEIFTGLSQRGHQVTILTNKLRKKNKLAQRDSPFAIRSLHLKSPTRNVFLQIFDDLQDLLLLNRLLREFQPDIIYLGHIQNLSNAILPYLSKRNYPLVFDEGGSGIIYLYRIYHRGLYFYRNENDSGIKKLLKELVYKFAGVVSLGLITPKWSWPENMRIFFNGQSNLQNALAQGAPVENAEVIHSGLNLSKFAFQPRRELGLPIKILMPSRIKEAKGCIDGIYLIQELKQRGILAELCIFGEVQSHNYYQALMDFINEMDLGEAVKIFGMISQEELSQYYRQSDFCFFSSYFNSGFSRVPLEAMASGCLVLTYGNEGSKESVHNGETGILVEEGDIIGLVESIQSLIEDPDKYQKMIHSAREEIESKFNLKVYVDTIETFLYELLNEARYKNHNLTFQDLV